MIWLELSDFYQISPILHLVDFIFTGSGILSDCVLMQWILV